MSKVKELQRGYVEKVWKVLRKDPFKEEDSFLPGDKNLSIGRKTPTPLG